MALTIQNPVIVVQLSAIVVRLDAILTPLKDDIATIRSQMLRGDSYGEKAYEDQKNRVVEASLMADKRDTTTLWRDDVAVIKTWMDAKEARSKAPNNEKEVSYGETQTHSSTTRLASECDPDARDKEKPLPRTEANSTGLGSVQVAPGFGMEKRLAVCTIRRGTSSRPIARPSSDESIKNNDSMHGKPDIMLLSTSSRTRFLFSVGSWTHSLLVQQVITKWEIHLQPHSVLTHRGVCEVDQPKIEWLIAWCNLPMKEATQKHYDLFTPRFPCFRLEVKLIFRAGSIDTNPAVVGSPGGVLGPTLTQSSSSIRFASK